MINVNINNININDNINLCCNNSITPTPSITPSVSSCTITCTPPLVLDPGSCLCVPPEECIPQPSCTPTNIVNLTRTIKGYAFYIHTGLRAVDIPDIGSVQASCGGGHTCCRTHFMPTLQTTNGKIKANRSISMDNHGVGAQCVNTQIPIPNFIKKSIYDRSDTFTFDCDPSLLNGASVYLDCLSGNCHKGVTMVVLVAYTTSGQAQLIFSSCLTPGQTSAKPIGVVDCNDNDNDKQPCESQLPTKTPTPTPTPTLTPTSTTTTTPTLTASPYTTPTPTQSMSSAPNNIPTIWRIRDSLQITYAYGMIVNNQLYDFPNPFEPLYYSSTGNKNFILEVYCELAGWVTLAEFQGEIAICNNLISRYPSQYFSFPIASMAPCEKLFSIGTTGDGQEWRDPDHEIAKTFVGTVDGEWTNLNNWQDANGRSPARFLPNISSNVIIAAHVTSVPTNYSVGVNSLTINSGINFAIEATCSNLVCYGTIDRPASPVCAGKYGKVTYTSSAIFNTNASLEGELIQNGGSDAVFNNNSLITDTGILNGSGDFDDSDNEGLITGNAEFDNASRNKTGGIVEGNAIFRNGSMNTQATVEGDATFYNDSANSFATVEGNAEFYDTSTNESNAIVQGNATFNNSSINMNTATVQGTSIFNTNSSNLGLCQGQATFNGNSSNIIGGVCQSNDNIFNGSSTNSGAVNSATFNTNARNTSTGVINNAAIFNDNSENEGDADGGATFNGSSINDTDGRASGATFNTNAKNKGEVMGSAIFNGLSINDTTGTVSNNAIFKDNSKNKGYAVTAEFINDACNDGGTAIIFIPNPPPCCNPPC